jgi:hypothetical protein
MMNDGPQDLIDRLNAPFKQSRSRRGRASVAKQRQRDLAAQAASASAPAREGVYTKVEDLQPGDVWKGWNGRQVVLSKPVVREGQVHLEYRKVRKDRSIIQAGDSIATTVKVGAPVRVLDHINSELVGSQEGSTTMAKVTRKGGTVAKKSGAKSAAKSGGTATAEKRARRSAEDVDALVPEFVEHLQGGGTMRDLKKEHGFSDDGPIRAALYRNGFDSKGNEHGEEQGSINPKVKAGKAQLVKLRTEGAAWFRLAFLADTTESDVKAIVAESGGPTGRVYTQKEKPAKAASSGKKSSGKKAGKKADEDPS